MRVRLGRAAACARHFGGMVGVVRPGAIDRRRPQDRRQQLGDGERLAGNGRGGRLVEALLRRRPVLQDAQHALVGGMARQLGGIANPLADHHPGARTLGARIGYKLVACHDRFLSVAGDNKPIWRPVGKRSRNPGRRYRVARQPWTAPKRVEEARKRV